MRQEAVTSHASVCFPPPHVALSFSHSLRGVQDRRDEHTHRGKQMFPLPLPLLLMVWEGIVKPGGLCSLVAAACVETGCIMECWAQSHLYCCPSIKLCKNSLKSFLTWCKIPPLTNSSTTLQNISDCAFLLKIKFKKVTEVWLLNSSNLQRAGERVVALLLQLINPAPEKGNYLPGSSWGRSWAEVCMLRTL